MPYCSKCSGRASLLAPASMRHENVRLRGNERSNARAIDAREGAQLDRRRRDRRAGVTGADDRRGFALFHQIDRAADGGILFPPNGLRRRRRSSRPPGWNGRSRPGDRCSCVSSVRPRSAGVADEEKFVDLRILAQGEDRAANQIRRPEIAAHGVESDLHRGANVRFSARECKMKKVGVESVSGRGEEAASRLSSTGRTPQFSRLDRQHLAALVISAGRTGGVRCDGAAALRAFVELRRLPAVRRLARAQAHLRGFAFRDSHMSRLGKQEFRKRQLSLLGSL